LKVVPEWLEDGLIVASPGTVRQINVMVLARFVDFLPPVELPIVATFVQSCRITTESKAHLVGHPCTCVGRRENWLHICDKSIQVFNHLTRISVAICTHSCPAVGRSDMHKGQTFEEPHTYVMKRQLNATSKSQASKK
jgi:hypothetical protein